MEWLRIFEKLMRKIFPSTFTIALFLTVLTFLLALLLTPCADIHHSAKPLHAELATDPLANSGSHLLQITAFWYKGLWDPDMMAFALQMMLILVLGYVLASIRAARHLIDSMLVYCTSTSRTAFLVAFLTIGVSFFNWGLGLIFGAVFARKAGEYAVMRNVPLNYPLVAAAGYSGLMVWHGGISGSAPLKVAETGHFISLVGRDIPPVDFSQTIFSAMNMSVALALILIVPAVLGLTGRKSPGTGISLIPSQDTKVLPKGNDLVGAERIDRIRSFSVSAGLVCLIIAVFKAACSGSLNVIDPNFLNFALLGLSLVLSRNIAGFLSSVTDAMGAASGILIQFPFYFGIMGIMKYSGLVEVFSGFLIHISTQSTFPVFTFLSAGLVNLFVPSGGGQWAVQGPVIIEAAQNLNVPLSKSIMALAYGDQITNMLQPFWALPLLGITGLKARDIIPYTLFMMVIGMIIFLAGLLIFP
ncbi:MAG: short-chain fatty acid transporter [Bacteroidales bacterium]|nr:short-chain fatty acid transporter [Bacteroidales bacterium]